MKNKIASGEIVGTIPELFWKYPEHYLAGEMLDNMGLYGKCRVLVVSKDYYYCKNFVDEHSKKLRSPFIVHMNKSFLSKSLLDYNPEELTTLDTLKILDSLILNSSIKENSKFIVGVVSASIIMISGIIGYTLLFKTKRARRG